MGSIAIGPLPEYFTLNTGAKIPSVGFGTWQSAPDEVETAVEIALKAGYRHIDCAAVYRNEKEVGRGLKSSGVKREDVFITSKLWNTMHAPQDVEVGLDKTLRDLDIDYVDLYLIHWPCSFKKTLEHKFFPLDTSGMFEVAEFDAVSTYKAMEKLLQTGKVKAIGLSNFNIRRMEDLLPKIDIIPACLQIEAHPYLQQPELLEYCQKKGILVEAYSPLGNNQTGEPKAVDDSVVKQIGSELGLDGGQVLASWAVQRNTVVLPKSVIKSRIESNIKIQRLPQDAFKMVSGLEKRKRFNFPARWGVDIFEEVGEEVVRQAALDAASENKFKFTV